MSEKLPPVISKTKAAIAFVILAVAGVCIGEFSTGFMKARGLDWRELGEWLGRPSASIETTSTAPASAPKRIVVPRPPKRELDRMKCERDKTDAYERWYVAHKEQEDCLVEVRKHWLRRLNADAYCEKEAIVERASRQARDVARAIKC